MVEDGRDGRRAELRSALAGMGDAPPLASPASPAPGPGDGGAPRRDDNDDNRGGGPSRRPGLPGIGVPDIDGIDRTPANGTRGDDGDGDGEACCDEDFAGCGGGFSVLLATAGEVARRQAAAGSPTASSKGRASG